MDIGKDRYMARTGSHSQRVPRRQLQFRRQSIHLSDDDDQRQALPGRHANPPLLGRSGALGSVDAEEKAIGEAKGARGLDERYGWFGWHGRCNNGRCNNGRMDG